jgi:hypothetical protein
VTHTLLLSGVGCQAPADAKHAAAAAAAAAAAGESFTHRFLVCSRNPCHPTMLAISSIFDQDTYLKIEDEQQQGSHRRQH